MGTFPYLVRAGETAHMLNQVSANFLSPMNQFVEPTRKIHNIHAGSMYDDGSEVT